MPPEINPTGAALLGLTAIVAALVAIVAFALMKFGAAARDARRSAGDSRVETALLSAALEEAIAKLRAQERATAARAAASERLSSQIIEGISSGLLVVNREGGVENINPAARRLLALDDEAPLHDYRTLLSGAQGLARVIGECLQFGLPIVRREVQHARARGVAKLGVTVTPLSGPEGTTDAVVCLFTDLTAVFELEDQLRLKEALARLGELTAGLAHEFRNGLATIHGYARLLDPATLDEPQRTYVTGLRAETEALRDLVTNFLNFAKPDPLTLAPVDLEAVLERARSDFDEVEITLAGTFGTIEGDEVLLRQAFSNLLRNGIEASAAAGRPARITITGERDERHGVLRVGVSDEGPGIALDALAQVFQPFFTTRSQGTGLGLAIVQKIVISHNGRIWASNRDSGGALFQIVLPIRASRGLPKT